MAFVGGDCIEITFNHPTVGSGTFFPKSGEDTTLDLGGYVSNDDEQMITGNGQMIDQMNAKRWSFESTLAFDANDKNELEKIQLLHNSPVAADWTFAFINGTTWGGSGKPVGDNKGNGNAATIALKVSGGGKLKKITG
jgi:hypothetical protein